jgi:L-aminopeptidase/D-esterase-like protein
MLTGPSNSLLDLAGLRVGQHTHIGDGWLSGVTVVLAPDGGMTAGVDVRGGGPGTRETDLLDPGASVQKINAITLSGGSAYGLAVPAGVADELGARNIGFAVGAAAHEVVPIVPAAVVFDLGRGGDFSLRPGYDCGVAAIRATLDQAAPAPLELGVVGAGTGAQAGGFKGGIGSASAVLPGGETVAALVVLNAMGTVLDERSGELLAARHLIDGDPVVGIPEAGEWQAYLSSRAEREIPFSPSQNTTLAVVGTDVSLTKAQCRRLAGSGHNGLSRAVNPVHTLFDGDTIFGISTSARPAGDDALIYQVMTAAGECVSRAIARALLTANSVTTPAGMLPSYLSVFPSAAQVR